MWMNESEIESREARYAKHPVLGPATRLLSAWRHVVNANSDGWHIWPGGSAAAQRLMELIQGGPEAATEAELKKAIAAIKRCCTKRGFTFPQHALELPLTPEQLWKEEFDNRLNLLLNHVNKLSHSGLAADEDGRHCLLSAIMEVRTQYSRLKFQFKG